MLLLLFFFSAFLSLLSLRDEVYIIIGVVVNPSILPSIFLLLSSRDALDSFTEGARALATQSDGTVGRKKLESLPREKLNVDHGGVMRVFMCVYVCVQYAVLLGAFRLSNNYRCTIYIYIHIYM